MNSKILLVKNIKMDKQYVNVLSYNLEKMLELCMANLVAQADNYSFLRQTGTIMSGFTYGQCLQANYIAFQNPDYSCKWFFAWIDEVVYKGDRNTEITFTIDAWSTWYTNWQPNICFINRQHVNDDSIGLHTIPENLDVGEVVQENVVEDYTYSNNLGYWVAVASNWKIKDGSTGEELLESSKGTQNAGISVLNNNVFGTEIFLFKITMLKSYTDVALFLLRTNVDKHIADVENIFILPNAAIEENNLTQHTASVSGNNFNFYTTSYNLTPIKFSTTINKITSFTDYTPKNNKCFVYPYNYIFLSNNNGSNNIYKYEDFYSEKCEFENQVSVTIGASCRIVPRKYKKMNYADDEAIALGKYPTCGWSSDAFTNWLTQNSVNIAVSAGLTAGAITTTIATGGVTAPILAGVTNTLAGQVGNLIGQFNTANLLPNIKGGQATGDIIWASDRNNFTFRQMRVKTEYLKIIDNYFTRFGYAIKKLEVPNITGRKYWNYLEIGGSDVVGYGDVPVKFMDIINNACRKGVTIWHSHSDLGNYNLDNIII